MRIQLDMLPQALGDAERLSPAQTADLATALHDRLREAGFEVSSGEDQADVDEEQPDWTRLTTEERAAGGFTYPELTVDGPADMVFSVFLRSVFLSTEPDFDAAQAATAQVVGALRAIDPLVVIPDDQWREIEQYAAGQGVAADGTITRPVLSWSELSDRAIALFDQAVSPEYERPGQERYTEQLANLGSHCVDLPPFQAAIASDPGGSSSKLYFPYEPPFTRPRLKPLQSAMSDLLDEAIEKADKSPGVPTGIVLDHHEDGTTNARLVYDNLVDSGATRSGLREQSHRSAPFAWEAITERAAQRDPAYQPTWLPEAVALLAEGGTDVEINRESSAVEAPPPADPTPVPESAPEPTPEPEPTRLRDRLRRWFGG